MFMSGWLTGFPAEPYNSWPGVYSVNKTGELAVVGDFSFDEKTINLNPNDGFDLGLMTTEHVVRIYVGADAPAEGDGASSALYGKVFLSNDVKPGSVEISLKTVQKLGGAKRVVLSFVSDSNYGRLGIRPA